MRFPSLSRRVAAVASALVAVGAAAGCAESDEPPSRTAVTAPTCNGSAALCDRRLDEVAFAATHNSYAASDEPGWHFANQRHGIERQLRDGIRGLLLDVHWGERDPGSGLVRTDLRAEGADANKAVQALPRPALRLAERLAGRAGLGATTGAPSLYLCHTLCELGAEPLDQELGTIATFLRTHPRDVLVVMVEPYVPPAAVAGAFDAAGLARQAVVLRRGAPLPTLGALIAAGTRLVVLSEEDDGDPPWYLKAFSFVQDTPYGEVSERSLPCTRARGETDSPLLLINHWISLFPPSPRRNRLIGGAVLRNRLTRCATERGQPPNLVAVDFYERSGVVDAVRARNAAG